MPTLNAQTRFFLRASTLVVGFLVLWWLVLQNPLLFLLKQFANSCASAMPGWPTRFITDSTGGWTVEVPIKAVLPQSPEHPAAVPIHSIDFDLPSSDAGAFTFGLPVYWAIVLAAGDIRRMLRPLLLGTVAMWMAEIALLLVYVELFAHQTVAGWTPVPVPVENWFYRFGDYLLVSVIPFVAPFAMALWLHSGLRRQILLLGGAQGAPVAGPRALRKRARAKH